MKIIIGNQNKRLESTQDKVEVGRPGTENCGALGEPGTVTMERREGRGVHHLSSNGGPQQSRADPVLVRMSHDNKQVGNVKTYPGSCPKQVVAVLGSQTGFPRIEWHRWGPQGPRTEGGGRKPQSCLQERRII